MEHELAPAFSLYDETGVLYSSEQLKGKSYILYFYPKDDTPGCTIEACSFRDHYEDFQQKDILILGIGKGTKRDHQRFREKYHLPFPLLVDDGLKVCESYHVLKSASMFGKPYMKIARTTFLIDEKGYIQKVWEDVNPLGHANQIMRVLPNS